MKTTGSVRAGQSSLRASAWAEFFRNGWRKAVQIGRASIGVPDYDTYVAHIRQHHPERTVMSYEAFFSERQNARYKGGGGRCC